MRIPPDQLAILAKPEAGARALLRGIEKESLRVSQDGSLSTLAHPESLGSPLTHPNITTDFSEAQLELITEVHDNPEACLKQLNDVHRFVYQGINGELLWPSSMPCLVGDDTDIPVGQYGTSNIGRAKTVYRLGLGLRYGRLMQTISGIHYNFSLPSQLWAALGYQTQDEITEQYFSLIRNFRRCSWLLIYLFGASPAVCRSFTKNMQHNLQPFDEGSQHLPYATSLRMGPLGYQSNAQSRLNISYNSLDDYASSMEQALSQTYPEYAAHGSVKDGEYQQLNSAILQIENEFYGTIRPKRRTFSGERPVTALRARGVEYVEVRCLDLNPFLPAGIDTTVMRFIDTFLLYCLLTPSPADSAAEIERINNNQLNVVERGRQPGLQLEYNGLENAGQSISMAEWANDILDSCAAIAAQLDQACNTQAYQSTLADQRAKLQSADTTPSARVLQQMSDESIPFFRFSMNQAMQHQSHFAAAPLSAEQLHEYQQEVKQSIQRQHEIEQGDTETFAEFLEHYLAL
ncbi:MAG: glutamate--cysteine ligase [Pseudomonadota bacterium]